MVMVRSMVMVTVSGMGMVRAMGMVTKQMGKIKRKRSKFIEIFYRAYFSQKIFYLKSFSII